MSERRGRGGKPGAFRGLPPLEEPVVEPGHRVMLVACSKTGRASWADLEPLAGREDAYRWVKNLPAVPDFKAIRGGKRPGSKSATGGGSSGDALSDEAVFWNGYHCGVCECDSAPVPGHEGVIFWQCSVCRVLYCSGGFVRTGEDAWHMTCPGCGSTSVLEAHEETGTISEYQASTGRREQYNSAKLGGGSRDGHRQLGGGANDLRRLPRRG